MPTTLNECVRGFQRRATRWRNISGNEKQERGIINIFSALVSFHIFMEIKTNYYNNKTHLKLLT